MGTFLFVIGALAILGVVGWYLYKNPSILGELGQKFQQGQKAVEAARREVEAPTQPARKGGYLSAKATPSERLSELPVGTFLFVSVGGGKQAKLQVKGRLAFHTRRQYGGSKAWEPDGTVWHGLLFRGSPEYFKGDVLLVQFGGQGYVFDNRVPLAPDQAQKQFGAAGKAFAQAGQEAGSVSLSWKGDRYPIQDLGVYDVETQEGDGHVPPGTLVRFIIANTDVAAVLVEDAKTSDDSVWTGTPLDIDMFVKEILTPEGN